MNSDIRVRFAPSPTGLLHIGGLRTALYNYLFARRHGGTFILRIEDTDQARYVEEAEQDILESLAWAGLHPDEGPVVISEDEKSSDADAAGGKPRKISKIEYDAGEAGSEGSAVDGDQQSGKTTESTENGTRKANAQTEYKGTFGPYHQSKRRERYAEIARQLVDAGHAYYAFDTVGQIEKMRERLRTADNPVPKYDAQTRMEMRNSLTMDARQMQEMIEEGAEYVVRLKVPAGETIRFDDLVRGPVSFESDGLDDQVLLKADGLPTYHLANVVDDHEMAVSHVIRGEEWLSSAPKHILLYRYLGWEPPSMAHLPLIMSPSGGKLSKRKAEEEGIPVNVRDYRRERYERDAVVNFLALLGWSPGEDREEMTLEEMTSEFSLDRVGKSGAIFDFKKLLWFNEHYMRRRSDEELAGELEMIIQERGLPGAESDVKKLSPQQQALIEDKDFLTGMVSLLKERVSRLPEFLDAGRFFFEPPAEYDEKAVKKGWKEGTADRVARYRDRISALGSASFKAAELKSILSEVIEEEGVGFGKLMMPLRIAVTGSGSGPDLFGALELLGQEEVVRRLDTAIDKLG